MPSDIIGSSLYNARTSEFVYREGPIFANIILADEINRTTPRTQSALLEAMSDGQVSVDGKTYPLPHPFMIIATQNPFEFEGTYPLPESQLDRFLLRTRIGYPSRDRANCRSCRAIGPASRVRTRSACAVLDCEQIVGLQASVRQVTVEKSVQDYLLDLVTATRESSDLHVGVSTRGTLSLYRASQALAFAEGRGFVVPDDVKRLAVPVLAHRVIGRGSAYGGSRETVEAIIGRIVETTSAPV